MAKKVIIIGAGPGGLSAGMLLAHKGYDVQLFEKKDVVGGRNAALRLGDFTFDTGPTFLMLPKLLEELFLITGRNISDYLEMKVIDPLYRLKFSDKNIEFFVTRDRQQMLENIKAAFPGDEVNYEKFLSQEGKKFAKLFKCLKTPYHSPLHFFRSRFIQAIPDFEIGRSLYQVLSKYFTHPDMRISMSFQAKYLGMSPWECPGAFTILSFIEHDGGIYHPIGGLNKISNAMAKVIEENGGQINLSTEVAEIIVEEKQAKGIRLRDGAEVRADYVIINADFAHAMTSIVNRRDRKKYTDEDLKRRDYSCSTFMLYLGLDKKYDLPHHNIIFADDYHKNVEEIYVEKTLPVDPSFYVQNPSIIDPTLAPPGKSCIYVLVPVANNTSAIDWENQTAGFRKLIIDKIKEKTEMKDIDEHIEVEKIITPVNWEKDYDIYNGATFNLSHKLTQMLYFRPHNKFEEFSNCYITGGGTHPGSGLPTIYESGRIVANLIIQDKLMGIGIKYKDVFDQDTDTSRSIFSGRSI
jgi:phytoene desaturase